MLGKILVLVLSSAMAALGSTPPTFRLPDSAKPLAYALKLTIVPERETFEGIVTIDTQVTRPTDELWLQALGLTIKEAAFLPQEGAAIPAIPHLEGEDFLGLALQRTIPAGRGRISIHYSGPLRRPSGPDGTHGLFAEQEDGLWYVFSQFEAIAAREAFPCFDEPGFKVPWQVTLRVPRDLVAVANAPETGETIGEDGLKTVRFATTKPLPSYLVALGVGPFEIVDAGKAGRQGTPLRILVTKGKRARAAYAARTLPELFTRIENYLDLPYAYEKLDRLLVPWFPGGMENAGLITYLEDDLLVDPEDRLSRAFERKFASLPAHEMAHQWFGDLVTMAWWNDTWLNESFATWMARKIENEWRPATDGSGDKAFRLSSKIHERAIHQPVTSPQAIGEVFDRVAYFRGANLLAMFEAYLGPAAFQRGVHQYLAGHAYGSATAQDFLWALAAQGDPALPAAFTTFLDQAGMPTLTAALEASQGNALLRLDQDLAPPSGDSGTTAGTWQIPVTLRYAAHGKADQQRFLVGKEPSEIKLPVPAKSASINNMVKWSPD